MSIEKVLEYSFGLFKRDIKVVLPNVLSWIPSALLSLILFQATSTLGKMVSLETFEKIFTDVNLLWQIIQTVLVYVMISIPVFILSAVISIFLYCAYSDITRQSLKRQQISLASSFAVAKTKFWPLAWTYTVEFLIGLLVFGTLLALGIFGGLIGIALAIFAGVIALFLMIMFFYETPAIVVLENRSGWEAVKRSYEIGRKNLGSLFIVVLIVGLISGVVTNGMASIPYFGLVISNLALLFLDAWKYMIPNLFYYEYGKKK